MPNAHRLSDRQIMDVAESCNGVVGCGAGAPVRASCHYVKSDVAGPQTIVCAPPYPE